MSESESMKVMISSVLPFFRTRLRPTPPSRLRHAFGTPTTAFRSRLRHCPKTAAGKIYEEPKKQTKSVLP